MRSIRPVRWSAGCRLFTTSADATVWAPIDLPLFQATAREMTGRSIGAPVALALACEGADVAIVDHGEPKAMIAGRVARTRPVAL